MIEQIKYKIHQLVQKYEQERDYYRSSRFNETQVRNEFLDPLFEILGWDIRNISGKNTNEREVLLEESLKANASTHSKAVSDGDGAAANVNRYICEVYTGGNRYMRKVNTVTAGTLQTTFDFKLVKGQTYDLLFWADCGNADGSDLYYNTASLKNVEVLTTQISCTDKRDAFFGNDQIALGETQITKTVYLKRPFAQLNIITTDISALYQALSGSFLLLGGKG